MKKLFLYFLLTSAIFAEVPKRIETNIYQESLNRDEKNKFVREQRRAYERLEKKGLESGMTKEQIDKKVIQMEQEYGYNYEVIYKYFVRDLDGIQKKAKIENQRKETEKKYEVVYKKEIQTVKLPEKIKSYIETSAAKKYPNSYQDRVRYMQELTEFYNFIKK